MKPTTPSDVTANVTTVPVTNKHPDTISWPTSKIVCNFSACVEQEKNMIWIILPGMYAY